jgi:hypothetical protein
LTDLYEAFLQRAPDAPGLSNWVSQVPINGRNNVRLAFAVSPEFAENVAKLCPGTSSSTSTSANLKYVLTDVQGSGRALMNHTGGGGGTPGNPVEPEDDAADDKGNAMSSAIEYKNFATSSRSEQMNSSKCEAVPDLKERESWQICRLAVPPHSSVNHSATPVRHKTFCP